MYGAMNPKSDVDRLYMKRKEGGRGLISVEQCVKGEENSLGFYVANSEGLLIRGVCASGTIQTEGTMEKEEFKGERQKSSNRNGQERQCMGDSLERCQKR